MFIKHIINVFLLIIFICGCHRTLADIPQYAVDIGQNVSIPCGQPLVPLPPEGEDIPENQITVDDLLWVREGRQERQIPRISIEPDGSLFLTHVTRNDSGIYSCSVDGVHGFYVRARAKVFVRTPPPPLNNVTVHPSTILALILWEVKETGGYPIIDFTAEFKLTNSNESWRPISPNHISPNSRQIDVYRLEPNTTYTFRVWATNQLGSGDITEVEGRTLHNVEEIELARHLLAGAENFDTRVWVAAVSVVMGTLVILSAGTCYLLYIECRAPAAVPA